MAAGAKAIAKELKHNVDLYIHALGYASGMDMLSVDQWTRLEHAFTAAQKVLKEFLADDSMPDVSYERWATALVKRQQE